MDKFALGVLLLSCTVDVFNILQPARECFGLSSCQDLSSQASRELKPNFSPDRAHSSLSLQKGDNPKFALYDPRISSGNPFYTGNQSTGSASSSQGRRAKCNFIAVRGSAPSLVSFAQAKGVAGLGKAGGDGTGGSDKAGQQVPPEVYNALTYAGTAFLFTLSVPLILYGLNKLLNKIEDCFGCGPSSRKETTKNNNRTDNCNGNNRSAHQSHDSGHNHPRSHSRDTNGAHKLAKNQSNCASSPYGEREIENRQLCFSDQHQQSGLKQANMHTLSDLRPADPAHNQMARSDRAIIEQSDSAHKADGFETHQAAPNPTQMALEYLEHKHLNLSALYRSPGSAVIKL